jgi:hypothetical protein
VAGPHRPRRHLDGLQHPRRHLVSARGTPSRRASVRTDSATSPSVRGSSDSTSAPTGHADARSRLDTAQTAQRSCVTIWSGASSAIRSRVDRVQRPAVANRRADDSSISRLERVAGSNRAAVTIAVDDLGRPATLLDTPTSESIRPNSAIISVALGRNEQIRHPRRL